MTSVAGHKKIISFLERSIKRDSLASSYLFTGPRNVGKFTVALEFARQVTGKKGLDEEFNPDILVIAPEIEEKKGVIREKDIKVEKIRDLEHALGLTAYFGGYKVAIVDDSERLTVAAQNALLKTLEEPPKNCVLVLVCHDSEKILPTIKSRCIQKRFGPVGKKEMKEKFGLAEADSGILWPLGRPGLLNSDKSEKKSEELKKIEKDLRLLLTSGVNEKFELAQELSKDIGNLLRELSYWIIHLREDLLKGNRAVKRRKSMELIAEISKSADLIKETNSNPRVVLENLFLKF